MAATVATELRSPAKSKRSGAQSASAWIQRGRDQHLPSVRKRSSRAMAIATTATTTKGVSSMAATVATEPRSPAKSKLSGAQSASAWIQRAKAHKLPSVRKRSSRATAIATTATTTKDATLMAATVAPKPRSPAKSKTSGAQSASAWIQMAKAPQLPSVRTRSSRATAIATTATTTKGVPLMAATVAPKPRSPAQSKRSGAQSASAWIQMAKGQHLNPLGARTPSTRETAIATTATTMTRASTMAATVVTALTQKAKSKRSSAQCASALIRPLKADTRSSITISVVENAMDTI